MVESPFKYDSIADKKHFFGRDEELKYLEKVVKYSNNLLIFSKRRMGKTALIKNFLDLKRDKYICLYADIFDITSKEDFAKSMLKSLSNYEKNDLKTLIKN